MPTLTPPKPSAKSAKSADQRRASLRTVSPTEHRQTFATHEWIQCPICTKMFVAAAVITTDPEDVKKFSAANFTGTMVYRRLFCDHCNIIIAWHQEWTNGRLGVEIGTYGLIKTPSSIEAFLKAHPAAAGVA